MTHFSILVNICDNFFSEYLVQSHSMITDEMEYFMNNRFCL